MTEQPFSFPGRRSDAKWSLLLAKQLLRELKIPFWLSHGTLLGAVRDGDFIAHDSDIDIGVWADVPDHDRIRRKFVENKFSPAQEFGQEGPGHQYSFWSPNLVYFDVFFYGRDDDRCWMGLWVNGVCKKMVFPPIREFLQIDFCGESFYIPKNYDAVLTANYGDWHVPVAPTERGGQWSWCDSPRNFEK